MSEAVADYILPPTLVGHADVARLIREVEFADNELQAQKVRGEKTGAHLPVMSQTLSDFLEANKIDASDGPALRELKTRLQQLKDHAPVIHMTFAVAADPESLQQLAAWLRQEVHPQALVTAGLQPALVAGVYMRTPNQVHDFTIRAQLAGKRDIITSELERLNAG